MIYYLIFLLQLAALALSFFTFFNPGSYNTFLYSIGCFALSLLFFAYGIIKGSSASRVNCFTILLILVNVLLYVLFLFTGYLGAFTGSGI